VQQVTGDLGQHSKRSQHGDQRSAPSHFDQIRARERMPSRLGVGLDDDCQLIGNVDHGSSSSASVIATAVTLSLLAACGVRA
jgi:hypothetical protein